MAESVQSPGVDISQVVNETPVVAQAPTLAPCVVGPCFEVMEATIDGAVNADAKINGLSYRQFPVVVPTSTFPTNNTTPSELVFQQGSVDALLSRSFGGTSVVRNLEEGPLGKGFLSSVNIATRPGIVLNYTKIVAANGNAWPEVSVYFKANKSLPVKISFVADASAQAVADKFIASGFDAALLTADGEESSKIDANDVLVVVTLPDRSANYGAASSISFVRFADLVAANADYNKLAGLSNAAKVDLRVEGSGIGISSSDTSTIEVKAGAAYAGDFRGVEGFSTSGIQDWTFRADAINGDRTMYAVLISDSISSDSIVWEASNAVPTLATSLSVKGAGPAHNGDLLYLDGVLQGQVMNVTDTSAKVVNIDAAASRYGADGDIIFQRYVPADLSGLNPRYAYIVAQNITVPGSAASVEIDVSAAAGYTAATKASISLFADNLDNNGDVPALQLQGTELHIRIDVNGVQGEVQVIPFEQNFDGADGQAALKEVIEENTVGISATVAAGSIKLEATEAGAHITLNVLSALSGSTANIIFQVEAAGAFIGDDTSLSDTGTDAEIAGLAGINVSVFFDHNPVAVSVNALDNTIAGLARQLNDAVFSTVAVFDADEETLTITSGTKGVPSQVIVPVTAILGVAAEQKSNGSGRPSPDLHVASNGTLHIGGQIFRSTLTGDPIAWNTLGSVDVHVSYKALRLDVSTSPVNGDAGLIKVSSLSDLVNNFGPINDSNPLGLGLYYALINTGLDGTEVSAVGVNAVSPSAPYGTAAAYGEALTMISGHEVYAIAPLTNDEAIISAFDQHVKSMSEAKNRAERILISAPLTPTTEAPTLVASGSAAESIGAINTIKLDGSHIDAVNEHIDALANPIPESDGLYIQIEINGESRKYSIKRMSGSNVIVRTDAEGSEFSSTPILSSDEFESADYTVGILGASLNIPGTSSLDGARFAVTVRNAARAYANRRHVRIFPGSVSSTIDGVDKVIPAFYYAAALAGDCASRPAQNPLTRNSLGGFTGAIGPKLSNTHLDIAAAGNFIIQSETPGAVPIVRMQCTTDADALENRELSIVKALDTFAKSLRNSLVGRVGRFNITQGYLDDMSLLIDSVCGNAVRNGLLANANLANLYQDPVQRDTLVIDVNVAVLYPANYIRLQIIV